MADLPNRLGRILTDDVERALNTARRGATTAAQAYTPGTAAHWASPAPTTVQEALNRIAAAVFAAHGAIP